MDYSRKNNFYSERGIALLTTLMVAIGAAALIAGIYYMLKGTLRISGFSRQFSSAQEAAFGGVEHGLVVVKRAIAGDDSDALSDLGVPSSVSVEGLRLCNINSPVNFRVETPKDFGGSSFNINITIQCVGYVPIPGSSESLVFPPPPTGIGGGGGSKSFYVVYVVRSIAKDTTTNLMADVEGLYRISR
ncbi:MAG: hypothetical protein WHS38_11040 [Thermodesulforhabdaceae bacterium]